MESIMTEAPNVAAAPAAAAHSVLRDLLASPAGGGSFDDVAPPTAAWGEEALGAGTSDATRPGDSLSLDARLESLDEQLEALRADAGLQRAARASEPAPTSARPPRCAPSTTRAPSSPPALRTASGAPLP
eukprot:6798478-Prymnesium_polylepis.1